ncbi:MAG: STAS domain-containing protein [Campylobacterales bacterium]
MIEIVKNEDLVIKIKDRLDATNSSEAMQAVDEALKDLKYDVRLDVSELEYISSAGLQVVLKCAKISKSAGREIYLVGAKDGVLEIFKISGFLSFLKEV